MKTNSKTKLISLIISFVILFGLLPLSGCDWFSNEIEVPEISDTENIWLSHQGGVYGEGFTLYLAPVEKGNKIYYTTDCTQPTESSALYTKQGIEITDQTQISSYPLMNSVNDTSFNGVDAPGCGTVLYLIEVDSNGKTVASENVTYIINSTYTALSKEDQIPVISLSAPQTVWTGDGYSDPGIYNDIDDDERKARVELEYYDASTDESFALNTQLKIGGNWTKRNYPKRTLNLNWKYADADKTVKNSKLVKFGVHIFGDQKAQNGDDLQNLTRVRLHSGGNGFSMTNFNDALTQHIARYNENVSTSATRPCLVYLNGEFWGFYIIREHYSDVYFANNYDVDEDNVMYCDKTYNAVEYPRYDYDIKSYNEDNKYLYVNGEKISHLQYTWNCLDELYSTITEPTVSYDAQGNAVVSYGNTIKDLSDDAEYAKFASVVDVDSLIDMILIHAYAGNWDFFYNNMRIWRVAEPSEEDKDNPYADGKWRFAVHDADFSFESPNSDVLAGYVLNNKNEVAALLAAPMTNSSFRARFKERSEAIIQTYAYAEGTEAYNAYEYFTDTFKPYKIMEYNRWNKRDVHTLRRYSQSTAAMLDALKNRASVFEAQVDEFIEMFADGDYLAKDAAITDENEITATVSGLRSETKLFDLSSVTAGDAVAAVNSNLSSEVFTQESGISFTFALLNSNSDWNTAISTSQVNIHTGVVVYTSYSCNWYEKGDDLYSSATDHHNYWSKLLKDTHHYDNSDRYIYITVNCYEGAIEFYRNGELVYRYGATNVCSAGVDGMTMQSTAKALIADAITSGFIFKADGMQSMSGLIVGTGLTQAEVLALYEQKFA